MHAHERAIHRFETATTATFNIFYNIFIGLRSGSFTFWRGSFKNETATIFFFIIAIAI